MAAEALFAALYRELHRMARRELARGADGLSLGATTLLHEAYLDIAGRSGGNHLFVVDQKETRYVDCSSVPLPYGERLVDDILNRTETAMPQAHTFLAQELALIAQKDARRLT